MGKTPPVNTWVVTNMDLWNLLDYSRNNRYNDSLREVMRDACSNPFVFPLFS